MEPTETSLPSETPTDELAPEATETPGSDELTGTLWDLVSFGPAGAENAAISGSNVTLEFHPGREVSGYAGCNSYHAIYEISGSSLVVNDLISTLMACLDDAVSRQEGEFLKALGSVDGYSLDGDLLVLTYDGGQGRLTFNRSVPTESDGPQIPVKVVQMLDATTGWGVGGSDDQGSLQVLFTSDGGQTWQDRSPETRTATPEYGTNIPAFYFQSDLKGRVSYPVTPGSAVEEQPLIWSTSDGGLTWTSQTLDIGTMMENFFPSDLGFLDDQLGWMVTHLGAGMSHDYIAIFQTQDGGASWQRISDPDQNPEIQACPKSGIGFVNDQEGWLAADCPSLMPQLSLYHTIDGGVTWEPEVLPLAEGLPSDLDGRMGDQCGIPSLWVDPLGNTRMVLRCMDYDTYEAQAWLYTLEAGGQGWQNMPLPAPYGDIDFIDAQQGWYLAAGLSDYDAPKELFFTTDGGQSWKAVAMDLQGNLVDFTDPSNGWIVAGIYGDLPLLHTIDGGQTWE